MVGKIQLDKENSIFPSTPLQQLKPTDVETRKRNTGSVSPTKRLPFATKDNNIPGSLGFGGVAGGTATTESVSKNLFSNIVKQQHIPNDNSNNINNNNNNNKKRLKKYGSILGSSNISGYNTLHGIKLPKTKSLVLKDPCEDENKNTDDSESESDEEWRSNNNPLQLKLQRAIKREASISPLNGSLKLGEGEDDNDNDNDIEYKSKEVEEIPYIPDGYIPFTQEDLNKLSEYHPHDVMIGGEDIETKTHESPTMLPLDIPLHETEGQADLLDQEETRAHSHKIGSSISKTRKEDTLELIPLDLECTGEGLNDEDIMDLIDSI